MRENQSPALMQGGHLYINLRNWAPHRAVHTSENLSSFCLTFGLAYEGKNSYLNY